MIEYVNTNLHTIDPTESQNKQTSHNTKNRCTQGSEREVYSIECGVAFKVHVL